MSSHASLRLSLLIAVVLSGALTAMSAGPAYAAGPSNDLFGNAITLQNTTTSGSVSGTNVGATKQTGEPDHAGDPGGASVWYRWTAPASGAYTFDTCTNPTDPAKAFDTLLAVYTGSTVAATAVDTNQIASNDDGCDGAAFGGSKVTFSAFANTVYRIAVDGYFDGTAASTGDFTLAWTKLTPPANDNYAQAQGLTGPTGSVNGSTVGASVEKSEPDHSGDGNAAGQVGAGSVWYNWTAPVDGSATFDTCISNFDTILAVYDGALPFTNFTWDAASDDDCPSGSGSKVVFDAFVGTIYHIAVDGHFDAATTNTGTFTLAWSEKPTPVPGAHHVTDFNGDGTDDISLYRPSTGEWYDFGGPTVSWGGSTDIPVPGDYDGDGTTDVAIYRPSVGGWYLNGQPPVFFGVNGDVPVPGDYDGDGTTDLAVFRPSVGGWYVNGQPPVFFGVNGDIPVPGDYDGSGTTDIAVFRPSVGGWYINGNAPVFFGTNGDIPVPGDYDGSGTTDIAVFRPSVGGWYINGSPTVFFGTNGDIPVPGDYDGSGTSDVAVFRPSIGAWFINGQPTVFFGSASDKPLPLPAAIRRVFFP